MHVKLLIKTSLYLMKIHQAVLIMLSKQKLSESAEYYLHQLRHTCSKYTHSLMRCLTILIWSDCQLCPMDYLLSWNTAWRWVLVWDPQFCIYVGEPPMAAVSSRYQIQRRTMVGRMNTPDNHKGPYNLADRQARLCSELQLADKFIFFLIGWLNIYPERCCTVVIIKVHLTYADDTAVSTRLEMMCRDTNNDDVKVIFY